MAERSPLSHVEEGMSHNARSLFPEGERGDEVYSHARALYTDEELLSLRQEFAPNEEEYYGPMQFTTIATGTGCERITARIDEKTQHCGEQGKTTVDFYTPYGDRDFIVACSEGCAQHIMIGVAVGLADRAVDYGDAEANLLMNNPNIGRNGFSLEEYNKRLKNREESDT